MQFLAIINYTAAIQGLFIAYILLNKKAESKEYQLLTLLMLAMAVAILGPAMGLSGYYREFPHLIRVSEPVALLMGPLLYFYISYLTQHKLPKGYWWHLLPFFAFLISLVPFYTLSGAEKIAHVDKLMKANTPNLLPHTVRVLHASGYILISLVLVQRFQKLLENNFSEIGKFNLDKATLLLRLYLVLGLVSYLVVLLTLIKPINIILINNISSLAISFIIYGLAYSTWNLPPTIPVSQLVQPVTISEPLQDTSLENKISQEKVRTSFNIPEKTFTLLAAQLEKLLAQDKVYLENSLSLQALSGYLKIPPYQASELINRHYQESFFDLINRYRIEEIKRRMEEDAYKHFSLLGLAMECGFNSKSSFNTAFKKFTGLTPSSYRKTGISVPA